MGEALGEDIFLHMPNLQHTVLTKTKGHFERVLAWESSLVETGTLDLVKR